MRPRPKAVFPLDATAAVDDALQESLQEELRAGLLVVEAGHPVFRVLAEERLEALDELDRVQAAVLRDVPGAVFHEPLLRRGGEFPGHDFGIDGVCHSERRILCH